MIKRIKNKDIPTNRLRLQASERNKDWPESIFTKFVDSISQDDIKFYPNLEELYNRLSVHYGAKHIQIGTGSDKCIETFIQSHMHTHSKLVVFSPSFPMYSIYGHLYGYDVEAIDQVSMEIPYEDFLSRVDNSSIVIISNPTSPLGQELNSKFINELLDKNVPTLIDEAYIEFSNIQSYITRIDNTPNLFVTRTFSKGYGSAGVRLGIILYNKSQEDLIGQYRPMYEINGLTNKWALTLLDNFEEVNEYVEEVKVVRTEIVNRCKMLNIPVIDGNCNWIHIQTDELPDNVIFKSNCKIPGDNNLWVRLQITSNLLDYTWLS